MRRGGKNNCKCGKIVAPVGGRSGAEEDARGATRYRVLYCRYTGSLRIYTPHGPVLAGTGRAGAGTAGLQPLHSACGCSQLASHSRICICPIASRYQIFFVIPRSRLFCSFSLNFTCSPSTLPSHSPDLSYSCPPPPLTLLALTPSLAAHHYHDF